MDTVMHLIQHMTANQKAETLKALNNQITSTTPDASTILQTPQTPEANQ